MPFILNIDTATEYGAVGLSNNDSMVAIKESHLQKDHASFVQPAIQQIMTEAGIALADIDAVAVTIGPGSYTGLRVALASAKGLCYVLNKPLITVSTLQVMALACIEDYTRLNDVKILPPLFCPMIDARRMEVFTATYNIACEEISSAKSIIIDENILSLFPESYKLVFSGDGSRKIVPENFQDRVTFLSTHHTIKHLALLALRKYHLHDFDDIAYCEPFYLKPFFTTASIKNPNVR